MRLPPIDVPPARVISPPAPTFSPYATLRRVRLPPPERSDVRTFVEAVVRGLLRAVWLILVSTFEVLSFVCRPVGRMW